MPIALGLTISGALVAIAFSVLDDGRDQRDLAPSSAPSESATVAEEAAPSEAAPSKPSVAKRAPASSPRASSGEVVPAFDEPAAAKDGGAPASPPPAPARAAARVARPSPPPPHHDGGVVASGGEANGAAPDGGAHPAAKARLADPRRREDDAAELEATMKEVDRFTAGGATLVGHVVEADTGRPLAGTSVHTHHDNLYVAKHTDAAGDFHMPGMLPGSRVVVWVGRPGDPFVDERIDVTISGESQVDLGTVSLLRGDELSSKLGGWVGAFVSRRAGHVVVSAVAPWLPADRAGLEAGDQILSVGGREVGTLGPRAVTFLLRGAAGTHVGVVARKREGEKVTLELERVLR